MSNPRPDGITPSQTVGPYFKYGLTPNGEYEWNDAFSNNLLTPHILLAVFARGMLLHLYTRIYFDDEAGNASDPVLASVPADRRATLIASRKAGAGRVYVLDVHLQGDNETVFFDL